MGGGEYRSSVDGEGLPRDSELALIGVEEW